MREAIPQKKIDQLALTNPGVLFTFGWGSYGRRTITWKDGPTVKQVQEILAIVEDPTVQLFRDYTKEFVTNMAMFYAMANSQSAPIIIQQGRIGWWFSYKLCRKMNDWQVHEKALGSWIRESAA